MKQRPYPGFFITLEGGDGSGKTTQMVMLAEGLRKDGHAVVVTREPGGTGIGEQIRNVIHSLENKKIHPRTETLLYQATRAQIVEEILRPHLELGKIILCDRFGDSTLAYQGFGHRQNIDDIKRLIDYATNGLTPDLTVLLDVDPEVGLKRRSGEGEWNRMDDMPIEFHRRVNDGYLNLIPEDPDRWQIINANKGKDEVYKELKRIVDNALVHAGYCEGNRVRVER